MDWRLSCSMQITIVSHKIIFCSNEQSWLIAVSLRLSIMKSISYEEVSLNVFMSMVSSLGKVLSARMSGYHSLKMVTLKSLKMDQNKLVHPQRWWIMDEVVGQFSSSCISNFFHKERCHQTKLKVIFTFWDLGWKWF